MNTTSTQPKPIVAQGPNGRWFITIGHAGFNLPANQVRGYETEAKALAAHKRLTARR